MTKCLHLVCVDVSTHQETYIHTQYCEFSVLCAWIGQIYHVQAMMLLLVMHSHTFARRKAWIGCSFQMILSAATGWGSCRIYS